jgi:hypothetical protein
METVVDCFLSLEQLNKIGKIFVTGGEITERHLFKKENPYAHAVPHISGWLEPGDIFLDSHNCWGEGISRKDDRPLTRDSEGRIQVVIKATTTGADVYIQGLPRSVSFRVNGPELSISEISDLAGQPMRLLRTSIGDMYQNGVGRWADHR